MANFKVSDLWKVPEINPINRKAHSIPILNPINLYGRVFFFSWFGFMVAFWAWYAFPPLLTATIKKDLHLTAAQVANSNIVSICATLLVRTIAGPLCDAFGPRWVFGGLLLLGAIPVGLAPLIQNAQGLYICRFFIGILGGTFVPCQVWATGFFDKNVVGSANALTGGWGNAGGGITYFIMPVVFNSFVRMGHSDGQAWRLTFIVPLVMVIATGILLIVLCPDSPTGKWSERHLHVQENLHSHGDDGNSVVDVPGNITDVPGNITDVPENTIDVPGNIPDSALEDGERTNDGLKNKEWKPTNVDPEAALSKDEVLQTAGGETIVKPTPKDAMKVIFSLQTWYHVLTYGCSFGAELAIDATLSAYYAKNFPSLGQTGSSNWAAMFGFLNLVTRPMGGFIADALYNRSGHNLWLKKGWITVCGVLSGTALIIIGQVNSHDPSTMFGLVALAAIFIEGGNGANFALVPHVHPLSNGIVSGLTGAGGNVGGVLFAIIFRFMGNGTDYATALWVVGCIQIGVSLLTVWIPPIPKNQIGGH